MSPSLFDLLMAPLRFLSEGLGLSPLLTLLVVSMLVTGAFVNWQFNHGDHHHDDHDE